MKKTLLLKLYQVAVITNQKTKIKRFFSLPTPPEVQRTLLNAVNCKKNLPQKIWGD